MLNTENLDAVDNSLQRTIDNCILLLDYLMILSKKNLPIKIKLPSYTLKVRESVIWEANVFTIRYGRIGDSFIELHFRMNGDKLHSVSYYSPVTYKNYHEVNKVLEEVNEYFLLEKIGNDTVEDNLTAFEELMRSG